MVYALQERNNTTGVVFFWGGSFSMVNYYITVQSEVSAGHFLSHPPALLVM